MEPSGRNRWQPWQVERPRKRLKQPKTVAADCEPLHGKEGVDGSSPSEDFAESPANRLLLLSMQQTPVTSGHLRVTFDVRTVIACSASSGLSSGSR